MYRILIVDDEPLARMGVKTLVNNCGLNVEVVDTAQNGKEAIPLIEKLSPDIIITDIRMPIMTGLELLKYVDKNFSNKPNFIILTSYQEFEYARCALKYEACDYLIKVELTKEILSETLNKIIEKIKKYKNLSHSEVSNVLTSRFYFNLLNYGYRTEEEIINTAKNLGENIQYSSYITIIGNLEDIPNHNLNQEGFYSFYINIMDIIKTAISMYSKCIVNAYNHKAIAIIMMVENREDNRQMCRNALKKANELCRQYFNITATFLVGTTTDNLMDLSNSFSALKSLMDNNYQEESIIFYSDTVIMSHKKANTEMNLSNVSSKLIQSFEHNDTDLFINTIATVQTQIKTLDFDSSINYISCVIHVIIHFFNNGEKILGNLFSDQTRSYQILYSYKTKRELVEYLLRIKEHISNIMAEQMNNNKYKAVINAKVYINDNINNKLTLNEVADAIGISQNYLCSLFKTYSKLGFNDYVSSQKVKKAHVLLAKGNLKVYEVSDMLGFDNPQYFSKVYKKHIGYSPTETASKLLSSNDII